MNESLDLEFKEEFSRSFLKTVSAFANYNDGQILFGITNNGEVRGVPNPDDLCLRIENAINDCIEPLPRYSLSQERDGERILVKLRVYQGEDTPYCLSGKAYRRSHTSTVAVDAAELRRLVLRGMRMAFEECPATPQPTSFKILDSQLRAKIPLDSVDDKVYRTLELMDRDGCFNNAAAVFSDENKLPGIDIVRFGDSLNVFLDRLSTQHTSALTLYESALEMFERHCAYEEVRGLSRERDTLVPEAAYREAIANAMVHREWDINAAIRVSFFDDRIEIVSPGGLPKGIDEEDYLSGRLSVLRNPIIAGVFARLGYIERFGTGILRIKESYAGSGRGPRFTFTPNSITVTLPVIGKDPVLSDDEQAILAFLEKEGASSRASIEAVLDTSKSTTTRLLNALVNANLVVVEGAGRATVYRKA